MTRAWSSSRGAWRRAAVVVAAFAAIGAVSVSPAHASTTRTVSGTVTCDNDNKVVGVWVASSAGGSTWAKWKADSKYKNHATFSASITSSAKSTSIRLDVGCGGSSSKWKTNNSTKSRTISGSKTVAAVCQEKTGKRATRCAWIPTPTSSSVVTRGSSWVSAKVAYNQSRYYKNKYGSYRMDCSGFVSMAWGLKSSYTTPTLPKVSTKIPKEDLRAGDILLNTASGSAGHAVIFKKWANSSRTSYVGQEENGAYGYTIEHAINYPYWSGNGTFKPYRKN